MTINYVCKRFIEGNPIKGAYMGVEKEGNKEVLYHRWSGTNKGPIAEIIDRKDNGDFTLVLHPHVNYGKTTHNNRIWGVLIALAGEDYQSMRYNSYVRYDVIVHDKKLDIDYHMVNWPLKFNYKGGNLLIDYNDLEAHTQPQEEVKPVREPDDNDNIKAQTERLTNILATV
jgi:hypothetical protein